MFVCLLPLYPAIPCRGARRGCVCLGSGFGCAPPLLAGVFGCVCARVRAPLVPRHSWLGCAVWVCAFGLGLRLPPVNPGWGVGVCVFVCVLPLYPATPGWGVRWGCVCLGLDFGSTPPILTGVLGCACLCACSPCTPPLLAGLRGVGVCALARVSAAPRHSWLGCWAVCVLVCALRLYPATPGWGVRCGCGCLGAGFGCAPPFLAGVLGSVCACVGALLAPRHSWLGCAVGVCVFGLGFRLHAATPGPAVGVCIFFLGVCSPCTPPLLAGVCGVGACAWARVLAVPRHFWLGCWAVCVLVWALRLYPATSCWGARRGCVCLGSGFSCAPPHLAGGLGCVCARVRAPLVPCRSWLGCAVWVCVFGLGFRLRTATPGWGVGVCVCWCACSSCTPPLLAGVCGLGVCAWARVSAAPRHSWLGCWAVCVLVCALRLHPATPGWVARCGCVCLGSGFGCAPPLLAGLLGCVCARVRAPLAPRHSWLGCAVWVCVFGLGFRLRPTTPGWGVGLCVCSCARSACTLPLLAGVRGVGVCVWARVSAGLAAPGWGVRCGCVCLGSGFGCAPPLLAGVCGVWVRCCLAPVRVPWFVACCARSPGLWHPAAVAAWHLSVCLGCGRRRASLACLVAPRGAPRLVWSGRSRCSGRLSRRRGAFPHPGGLHPRLYWAAAGGTGRPAENRAPCACCWPPPRRGRSARSASYPFGAPRWGCPWRVPPALVLGCVRCGGWRVWTRSLTRAV